MWKSIQKDNKTRLYSGFTLIELLVSLFILVVLTTIILADFRRGEKQTRVRLSADIVTTAIRTAQNYTLSGKQLDQSTCTIGGVLEKSAVAYYAHFHVNDVPHVHAEDKCGIHHRIGNFPLLQQVRLKSDGLIIDGAALTEMRVVFYPPFGRLRGSAFGDGSPIYQDFSTMSITVEYIDSSISRTITVDGISGRIQTQ
jgi:prepilin-type N-terminal cleavage/methylation domain-containing protein